MKTSKEILDEKLKIAEKYTLMEYVLIEAMEEYAQQQVSVKPEVAEIENLKRALRVIYTWAKYDNGALLRPDDVVNLLDKYKKQFSV